MVYAKIVQRYSFFCKYTNFTCICQLFVIILRLETQKSNNNNCKIMKAKQLFRFAMVAVCAVAMTSLLSSCDKTDEPQNPTDPEQPQAQTAASACMDLTFRSSAEMLQFFALTLEYYDENGKVVSEAVQPGQTTKNIKSASLPAKVGFRVSVAEKEGLDRSQFDKFQVDYGYECKIYTVDKDGKKVKEIAGPGNDFKNGWAISKMDGWLESYKSGLLELLYQFDANGVGKSQNW